MTERWLSSNWPEPTCADRCPNAIAFVRILRRYIETHYAAGFDV